VKKDVGREAFALACRRADMEVLLGLAAAAPDEATIEWAQTRSQTANATDGLGLTLAVYGGDPSGRKTTAARVRDRLERTGAAVTVRLIESDPGPELVELAGAEECDCIVLQGGSRSPLGKVQLDEVVEFVVLNAHTTVTLVR
jgi:Universal stress protein family.